MEYSKMEWEIVPRDEQETAINVDYDERKITFYTNRKNVAKRMYKKIGEPNKIDAFNGKINGVTYVRNLNDKSIKAFLSLSTIVGSFRKTAGATAEED